MKKYLTKVNFATSNAKSLKCGIPKQVVEHLQLEAGDSVKWIIDESGKVFVEKLDL